MKKEYTCPHCGAPLWVTTEETTGGAVHSTEYSCDCRFVARQPVQPCTPDVTPIVIIEPGHTEMSERWTWMNPVTLQRETFEIERPPIYGTVMN